MAITIAVLSLLGALVPVLLWYLRRKHSPTLEETLADTSLEYQRVLAEVAAARARGDDAGAESLLRRMRLLAQGDAERDSNIPGQCHPGDVAGGNSAAAAKPQGD